MTVVRSTHPAHRAAIWWVATLLVTTMATPAMAQHEEEVAPLIEQLWTRRVRAVQPRKHVKARRFELVAVAGVIPNDPFVVYLPLGLRLAYHLTERWALEVGFAYNLQLDTDLRDYLQDSDAQLRATIRDRQQLRGGASLCWSPVYGKLALGSHVVQLDAFLVGGAGVVRTAQEQGADLPAATRPDFHLGAGLRLFIGRRWLLRLELRQYLFLRPEDQSGGGGGVGLPSEISLGGGILLGGG